jgi:hypothetical protein
MVLHYRDDDPLSCWASVVLGENGREAEICQRSVEVDAADKLKAADLAKVSFCESECREGMVTPCRPGSHYRR